MGLTQQTLKVSGSGTQGPGGNRHLKRGALKMTDMKFPDMKMQDMKLQDTYTVSYIVPPL